MKHTLRFAAIALFAMTTGLLVAAPAHAVAIDRPLLLTLAVTVTRYQTCDGAHCYSNSEWDDDEVPDPFIKTFLVTSAGNGFATIDELEDLGLSGPRFNFRWGAFGFDLVQGYSDETCETSPGGDCLNPFTYDGECRGCQDQYFVYEYAEFHTGLAYRANLSPGLSWNRWRHEILRTTGLSSRLQWDAERLYWECAITDERFRCYDEKPSGHEQYLGAFQLVGIRAVPEPGTIALLGLGLVGMGVSRRRPDRVALTLHRPPRLPLDSNGHSD